MPLKNHFWFHKEPFSQRLFKEPSLPCLFIIWRTFFHHKEHLFKQKGYLDGKGSLWTKTVLLWHREAPLFLRACRAFLTDLKSPQTEVLKSQCDFCCSMITWSEPVSGWKSGKWIFTSEWVKMEWLDFLQIFAIILYYQISAQMWIPRIPYTPVRQHHGLLQVTAPHCHKRVVFSSYCKVAEVCPDITFTGPL